MTRVTTLTTSDQMTAILGRTQQRVQDLQTQVTTGRRAQSYAGIAGDASRLISTETRRSLLARFEKNNVLMQARVDASAVAVTGAADTIRNFRAELRTAISSDQALTPAKAADLQQAAFRAMQTLQASLNTEVDGRA